MGSNGTSRKPDQAAGRLPASRDPEITRVGSKKKIGIHWGIIFAAISSVALWLVISALAKYIL